jgi:hypothetical protein
MDPGKRAALGFCARKEMQRRKKRGGNSRLVATIRA